MRKKPSPAERPSFVPRAVPLEHYAARGLNGYFLKVMAKHHPHAEPEEVAVAMGGYTSLLGEVFFDEEDDEL